MVAEVKIDDSSPSAWSCREQRGLNVVVTPFKHQRGTRSHDIICHSAGSRGMAKEGRAGQMERTERQIGWKAGRIEGFNQEGRKPVKSKDRRNGVRGGALEEPMEGWKGAHCHFESLHEVNIHANPPAEPEPSLESLRWAQNPNLDSFLWKSHSFHNGQVGCWDPIKRRGKCHWVMSIQGCGKPAGPANNTPGALWVGSRVWIVG